MATKGQALITGGHGDLAQALASELERAGMVVQTPSREELDVCHEDIVEQYFATHSGLDLLVCNAGVTDDAVLMKMKEESWDSVLETNLKGAFFTARSAAKQMVKRRVGLTGLALSMAQELGSRNIRVNVIVPGFMETKMTESISDSARDRALTKHVLGSFNTPITVAKFLSTLHLSMPYTSGQIFNLDSRIL